MTTIEVVLGDITREEVDAIATGVYQFPPQQAATIAVSTIRSTPTSVERVRLVAFDDATHAYLTSALAAQR